MAGSNKKAFLPNFFLPSPFANMQQIIDRWTLSSISTIAIASGALSAAHKLFHIIMRGRAYGLVGNGRLCLSSWGTYTKQPLLKIDISAIADHSQNRLFFAPIVLLMVLRPSNIFILPYYAIDIGYWRRSIDFACYFTAVGICHMIRWGPSSTLSTWIHVMSSPSAAIWHCLVILNDMWLLGALLTWWVDQYEGANFHFMYLDVWSKNTVDGEMMASSTPIDLNSPWILHNKPYMCVLWS